MPRKRNPPRYHLAIWRGSDLWVDRQVTRGELNLIEEVVTACGVNLSSYFGSAGIHRFHVTCAEDAGVVGLGDPVKRTVTITRTDRRA